MHQIGSTPILKKDSDGKFIYSPPPPVSWASQDLILCCLCWMLLSHWAIIEGRSLVDSWHSLLKHFPFYPSFIQPIPLHFMCMKVGLKYWSCVRGNNTHNTQGIYATQESSGVCHLMPQRHPPEWRVEDKWAFVPCGSSGLNHAITSNWICYRAF